MTIHFRGERGKRLLSNYLALKVKTCDASGTIAKAPMIEGMSTASTVHHFSNPQGLLFSTEFSQLAVLVTEQAAMADLREKGVVPPNCRYAGHSLGEYAALLAFADLMPVEKMVSSIFYRGLSMQLLVNRGEDGSTGFAMAAVNPSRIGSYKSQIFRFFFNF